MRNNLHTTRRVMYCLFHSLVVCTLPLVIVSPQAVAQVESGDAKRILGSTPGQRNGALIKILRDGVNVSDPKLPEQQVMVGEQINLDVAVPSTMTGPISYKWDIKGDNVQDYKMEGQEADPDQTPPKIAKAFTAEKVSLSLTDLQSHNPKFYWYNGTFTGSHQEVQVVVTNKGLSTTVSARFKVFRPQMNGFIGTYVDPGGGYPLVDSGDDGGIHFYPGISFSASVKNPNIPTAQGEIALLQTVSSTTKVKGVKNGVTFYEGVTASSALDSDDDDPVYGTPPLDSKRTIAPGGSATTSGKDTPNFLPSAAIDHVDLSDSFISYLVYMPSKANSIYVVLGKVEWAWSATAERNGTGPWNITHFTPQTPGSITPDNVEEHELPEWKVRIKDLPFKPIPAW